jgi:hypothetical protein
MINFMPRTAFSMLIQITSRKRKTPAFPLMQKTILDIRVSNNNKKERKKKGP